MSDDPQEPGSPAEEVPAGGGWTVDARRAQGFQFGRNSSQYNYFRGSSAGSRTRPPLARDSPYLGLEAFSEEDERIFFGRDEAASQVLNRMSGLLNGSGRSSWSELLVVSGVSGSGKSSLMAAGVLPRILGGELAPGSATWPYLIFTPTAAPLDELAKQVAPKARADSAEILRNLTDDPVSFAHTARQVALAPPDSPGPALGSTEPASRRLVLVVDQLEQLFTQCKDPKQRRDFITALSAAASGQDGGPHPGAFVVLVVRADFEAQCADYPELKKAVQDRYLLTSMTERQLRLAITEPAKQLGASVDSDLVEHLLQAMLSSAAAASPDGARRPAVSGAGSLPLLSHALNQAWREHTGQTVALADYLRIGGIEGAVEKSAQQAYDSLSPSRQVVAQRVFTRLVATSRDDRDTADRVSQADLKNGRSPGEAEDVDAVLRTFADKRLLTLDADTVQISHDVLLTAWPRLSGWLDETRDSRKARARLHTAVAEWKGNARHRSYLWELDTVTDTEDKIRKNPHHGPLSQDEDDFLRDSTRAQHRRVRVRRLVAAALTILALLTTALAAVTVYRSSQLARQLAAVNAESLGRESQVRAPTDIATAAQLALAGWRSDPKNPQARAALANAYLTLRSLDTEVVTLPRAPRKGIMVGGDTALVLADPLIAITGISGPDPRRWDIPDTSTDGIGDLSPDGRWFAWVAKDGTLRIRDLPARSEPRIVATGLRPGDGSVAFSPDGQRLASLAGDGHGGSQLRIWDRATGALVPNGVGSRLGTDVFGFWLTPDPRAVLVRHGPRNGANTRLVLHSLSDGSELATMPPFSGVARAGAAVVSCDNPRPTGGDATVVVTSTDHATPPVRFSALSSCFALGLSDDGGWLVEKIADGSASGPGGYTLLRLTDLRNGQSWQVTVPPFELGEIGGTVAYPLSTLGVSTAAGQPAVLLAHGASLLRLRAEPYPIARGKPPHRRLADGGRFLSTSIPDSFQEDGQPTTLTVQDRATGRLIATIPGLDGSVVPVLQGNSLWLSYQAQQHWQFDRYEVSPLRKVATFIPPGSRQSGPDLGAVFVGRPANMLITVSGGVLSALDPMTGRPLAPPVTLSPPGVNDGMGMGTSDRLAPRPGHPGQVAVWGKRDVQIWDALGGRKVATIPVATPGNNSMAFDPSGRRIALLTQEKTIELWDVDTVRRLHQPIPSADTNALVGFDADGYLDILTSNGDRLVFIDLDQGRESGSMDYGSYFLRVGSIVGDPVVPIDSIDESRPYELPVTAQTWHDKLCTVANRPFTPAELGILPPGTDTDPPCS
jgi:WD40 repeat protein